MKIYLAGGESRHWLNAPLIENNIGNQNANISGGRILPQHGKRSQADCMGGIVPVVNHETVSGKPSHNAEIQGRTGFCNETVYGGSSIIANSRYRGGFDKIVQSYKPYILESFFYADETTEKLLPYFGDFLLDSGAFTFMQSNKNHTDWEQYIKRYADFINRNNIQKFFELDIDSVVGYEKVLEYRKTLENLTNKQCIPVWHKSRGINEYKKMCDKYDYVAIGGIVSKEIKPEQYSAFPALINEAHKRKAKVHGLGFTALQYLPKIHFDSVDSTAWTTGNRFGFIYQFNGKTMIKHDCPKGKRLADSRKVAEINYLEWIKFQRYAEKNL